MLVSVFVGMLVAVILVYSVLDFCRTKGYTVSMTADAFSYGPPLLALS